MAEFLGALAAVLAVAVVVVVGTAALAVIVGRRALRRLRRRLLASLSGHPRDVAVARLSWPAARARRELWRSVGAAEQAVDRAARAQAPVGELPLLARRLRAAAVQVDHVLVVAGTGRGPLPASVAAQVRVLDDAAGRLHAAAVAAVTESALPVTRQLQDDIDLEVRAVAAGVARWRAAG